MRPPVNGERLRSTGDVGETEAVCCLVADHHAVARRYPADGGHAVTRSQTTTYPASWVDLGATSRPLCGMAYGQRHAQALREGAFVADAKQTPPVPRRRAKRHRAPCGSLLASWNVKAGSAAAPRSRRSPKCSQKAARQCGLVVRPNDVLARERCGLAGSTGGGVLARLGCGLAGSAGGGVLASEGIRSMDGAGLQITRCDDGHADPRDVCAPAMTRRAGRAVCAGTDSACSGIITIADPVDKKSSSLFYKHPKGFDFSTSSGPPLAFSLVHESFDYRHGTAELFVVSDTVSSSP